MEDMVKTAGGVLVPASKVSVQGVYHGQIIRDGKIIDEFEEKNLVVNEGLNSLLNINFMGATQITSWYLALFEGNYTPVATVTAATIVAAATETTAYTASTRQLYVGVSSTTQSMTNAASRGDFIFNASKTIYGAFLVSNSAKSATTGTLFSAARFASAKTVASGDELLLTYTFSVTSS